MKILVTGGAGFIGSSLVKNLVLHQGAEVLCIDKLTYAANLESIGPVKQNPNFRFEEANICDLATMDQLVKDFKPDAMMCLAAETHVDRSIDNPMVFLETNIIGVGVLLHVATDYFLSLSGAKKSGFRFLQVSTDEVYGDLEEDDDRFVETDKFVPSSPYSASKAAADHLVAAWHRTYGLPVLTSHCSNNYGPFQYPEKLIPIVIARALKGKSIPVFGDGKQIRDWIYVDDHVEALITILAKGRVGETYNIGSSNELSNIEMVRMICGILDELVGTSETNSAGYQSQITFVRDRPGHDRRYAINSEKIRKETGWHAKSSFDDSLRTTVEWYVDRIKADGVLDPTAIMRRGAFKK